MVITILSFLCADKLNERIVKQRRQNNFIIDFILQKIVTNIFVDLDDLFFDARVDLSRMNGFYLEL
jgi:hypothetical protein